MQELYLLRAAIYALLTLAGFLFGYIIGARRSFLKLTELIQEANGRDSLTQIR